MGQREKERAKELMQKLVQSRRRLEVDVLKLSDEELSFFAEKAEREKRALKAKRVVSGEFIVTP